MKASVLAGQSGTAIPSDLTPDLIDLSDDVADVGECDYQLSDARCAAAATSTPTRSSS